MQIYDLFIEHNVNAMECIARDARDGTMHAGALERSPVARDEWLHGWQRRAIVSWPRAQMWVHLTPEKHGNETNNDIQKTPLHYNHFHRETISATQPVHRAAVHCHVTTALLPRDYHFTITKGMQIQ